MYAWHGQAGALPCVRTCTSGASLQGGVCTLSLFFFFFFLRMVVWSRGWSYIVFSIELRLFAFRSYVRQTSRMPTRARCLTRQQQAPLAAKDLEAAAPPRCATALTASLGTASPADYRWQSCCARTSIPRGPQSCSNTPLASRMNYRVTRVIPWSSMVMRPAKASNGHEGGSIRPSIVGLGCTSRTGVAPNSMFSNHDPTQRD